MGIWRSGSLSAHHFLPAYYAYRLIAMAAEIRDEFDQDLPLPWYRYMTDEGEEVKAQYSSHFFQCVQHRMFQRV